MNIGSLITIAQQMGIKLQGEFQTRFHADQNGINIVATDSKNEWTARIQITRNQKS